MGKLSKMLSGIIFAVVILGGWLVLGRCMEDDPKEKAEMQRNRIPICVADCVEYSTKAEPWKPIREIQLGCTQFCREFHLSR